jgi:hypothetical protein
LFGKDEDRNIGKRIDCSAGREKDGEKDGRFFVEMLF